MDKGLDGGMVWLCHFENTAWRSHGNGVDMTVARIKLSHFEWQSAAICRQHKLWLRCFCRVLYKLITGLHGENLAPVPCWSNFINGQVAAMWLVHSWSGWLMPISIADCIFILTYFWDTRSCTETNRNLFVEIYHTFSDCWALSVTFLKSLSCQTQR